MTACILITLALYLISLISMNVNLVELENRIQTLTEGYADLSRLVPLLQARVEELGMLVQRVGALEDAKQPDEASE